jgi:hypothetical protein
VGQLIYHQEHYDLAFFSVSVDQSVDQWVQSPLYNDGVKWGELVFWLGRDAKFNLTMTHLRPGYMNPNTFERPHYMFFPGKEHIIKVKAYSVKGLYCIHYFSSLSCFLT